VPSGRRAFIELSGYPRARAGRRPGAGVIES
jgi:hypothetical protein